MFGPRHRILGCKTFSSSTQLRVIFTMLINVKMPRLMAFLRLLA